ncbi:hypothetical protein ACFY2R_30485 [Micromonospora olivasterospora]|uniref:hypothetical protein n=1 Tax=Micromonospora olivasterospora TaxID=1880 RepID=UPI0031DB2FB5
MGTVDPLKLVAECRWVGEDEQSQQVRAILQNLFGNIVLGVFGQTRPGSRARRWASNTVSGVKTEKTGADLVPAMSGGHRG